MAAVDPFSLVQADKATFYLPATYVREQNEQLIKAAEARRKISAGKVFSDYRTIGAQIGPAIEKPAEIGLPFDLLRSLASTSPIDRIIIDTRIIQMKRMARRAMGRDAVGFAVRHVRDADPDFDVPEGIKNLCRELEQLLNRPTAPFHATARDFFAESVEEELTIDRKAMVIARDMRDRPVRFHLIDGATIRPVPVVVFAEIQKEYNRNSDRRLLDYEDMLMNLSESSGYDLTQAAYVQIVDGQIVGAWRDSEMSVDITNPSVALNMWGYGRSLLEKSWRLSESFIRAWSYNTELFKLNYPEAVLAVKGDYDDDGLRAFKRKVLGEGDGRDNNWRLPVIPFEDAENGGLEMIKLRDTPRDMMYAEFLGALIRLKCAAYRMHPSMVNFSQDSGGGILINPAATTQQEIEQSQEEGFHAMLDSIADWLTRTIVAEYHEDLQVVWLGLNRESEDARVDRAIKKVENFASINEVRVELGMQPIKKGIPDEPGDFIGGVYLQAVQMLQQQQMQQQAPGGDGYEDGDFGDSGEGDMPPWMRQQGNDPEQPVAEQPQQGGPQHLDEEAEQVRKSLDHRFLRILIDRGDEG